MSSLIVGEKYTVQKHTSIARGILLLDGGKSILYCSASIARGILVGVEVFGLVALSFTISFFISQQTNYVNLIETPVL